VKLNRNGNSEILQQLGDCQVTQITAKIEV